uniref:Uncharacterized protein n=1 Tax=Pseudictyota dubia TaxID=2749911 RepID=A0A7R9VTC3_9STRA
MATNISSFRWNIINIHRMILSYFSSHCCGEAISYAVKKREAFCAVEGTMRVPLPSVRFLEVNDFFTAMAVTRMPKFHSCGPKLLVQGNFHFPVWIEQVQNPPTAISAAEPAEIMACPGEI